MKTTKTPNGPFPERPYYERYEIESTAIDALSSVDLLPRSPEPVRVERFIEKKFRIVPEYEDLPGGYWDSPNSAAMAQRELWYHGLSLKPVAGRLSGW